MDKIYGFMNSDAHRYTRTYNMYNHLQFFVLLDISIKIIFICHGKRCSTYLKCISKKKHFLRAREAWESPTFELKCTASPRKGICYKVFILKNVLYFILKDL